MSGVEYDYVRLEVNESGTGPLPESGKSKGGDTATSIPEHDQP
jgi:hypothetical protein